MNCNITTFLTLTLTAISWHPFATGDEISSFDANDEGWNIVSLTDPFFDLYNIVGVYDADYNFSGGNPGGYISKLDPDSGAFMFSAPANYLGNQLDATELSYDLLNSNNNADYQTSDVILEGNGTRLLWKSIPDLDPGPSWLSVSLSFSPSASWRVDSMNGAFASDTDFQNVLSNLSALYIRGEYVVGLETAGIDNVRVVCQGPALLGDVNQDGVVDLLDVAPFVALLVSGEFQAEADIIGDGVVDLLDVTPFVKLLTGG